MIFATQTRAIIEESWETLPVKVFSWKQKPPYQVGDLLEPDWEEKNLAFKEIDESNQADEKKDIEKKGYYLTDDGKIGLVRGGSIELPAFKIFNTQNSETVARSSPESFEVPSQPTQQQKQLSLLGPVILLYPLWIKAVFIFLLVLITIGVIYYFYKRHKKKKQDYKAPEIVLTQDQVFERALDTIEKSGLVEKKLYKKFYFSISEAFKKWISFQFEFEATEMTSDEICLKLEEILSRPVKDLKALLDKLDWVKFTDHTPDDRESYQLLREVRFWADKNRMKIRNAQNVE